MGASQSSRKKQMSSRARFNRTRKKVPATSTECSVQIETDTLEKARIARQGQGFHENEVSYGGEADLHKHYKQCDKNPGHLCFIPVKEFNVENLPRGFRDSLLVDYVRTWADLTCRLSVSHTSEARPQFFPGTTKPFPFYNIRGVSNALRTGTGCVGRVKMYKEEDNKPCECRDCSKQTTPTTKKWGEVWIVTAAHVVFDQHESVHTECDFFYDNSDNKLNKILKLRGLEVVSDIKDDGCEIKYVTHDRDILYKFYNMCRRREDLWKKLSYDDDRDYFQSSISAQSDIDSTNNLSICVSHPHGCSKMISVGVWTHRQPLRKRKFEGVDGKMYDGVFTKYTYTTPTCRGSSGAIVFTPVSRIAPGAKLSYPLLHHQHSEGYPGNRNVSGARKEYA